MAGGAGSDDFYLFETRTMGLLAEHDLGCAVYSLDFAHMSNRVGLGCGDGSIKIFEVAESYEEARVSE